MPFHALTKENRSPSDASCFDTYPEIDIKQYGREGPDTYGHLFAAF